MEFPVRLHKLRGQLPANAGRKEREAVAAWTEIAWKVFQAGPVEGCLGGDQPWIRFLECGQDLEKFHARELPI
jgi:hypothetical protein